MSGHHPQVLATTGSAWVNCECGWQSPVVRPRALMRPAAAASVLWARHLAAAALRRAAKAVTP